MSNWRWLYPFVRTMKWSLILAVALCLLDMLTFLGITGVQKWLIDDVFISGQYNKLPAYLSIFALLIVGYNAIHLVSYIIKRSNEFRVQKKISIQLMKYIYKMTVAKYSNERIGNMAQRFSGEIAETGRFVAQNIPDGITDFVKMIVLIVFVGSANMGMIVMICILSLVYIVMGRHFAPKQKLINKEIQAARSDVLVHVEEGISSTREVIAFHRNEWEIKKYDKSFTRFYEKIMQEGKLQNKQLAWSEPFRWGMNLVVLGYGAYLAINQQMSVGTFVVIYQFSAQLLEGINSVFGFFMNFSAKLGSVERLKEFVKDTEPQNGIEFIDEINEIRFDKVSFQYLDGGGKVLNELELDLQVGKKIAFVGSSGGGKSTIAQLLERFYEPVMGEITVNGIPLRQISLASWRNKVNLVLQEPYLFPDTIRNNLMMGREQISEEQVQTACQAAEIHEYIESLPEGYDTLLGERGVTLSGGQRQRLAIARSLLSEPEVLILDEATSALDMETERRVQRNLDVLRKGKTTIIIAHRLSTIENADIIYVMNQGRVVEWGTHEQLLSKPGLYKDLVSAHAIV